MLKAIISGIIAAAVLKLLIADLFQLPSVFYLLIAFIAWKSFQHA